ncbi:type IV toxin-antitoxin system AbiEi family antitoxin [Geobacter pelophilus]|uniref:Type IV toxin-antitoxin system AbiEi family antitoxin n=1 Tax=Geoanaerobacter pelophilus TaxID=60036 RepID=A0AAW4LE00_9BACT|nr:type IV toxin-antitoxin system AbiEi family antitoxin [Geoanaerobacter pelophilus]MBT0666127.1 type IV toxin-antitoxin system AbiEi family antitoxin [Geoanaerobacter pelophilus]
MGKLEYARRDVHLNELSNSGGLENRPLEFEDGIYTLKNLDQLSIEAIELLLEIHPIYVVAKQRRRYYIVAGFRTFQAASLVYKSPHQEIPVRVLDRHTPKETLELLCYLNLSVTPILFRIGGSLADSYQLLTNSLQDKAWRKVKSIQDFANVLDVAPSTLCKPKKRLISQIPKQTPKDIAFSNAGKLKLIYSFLLFPDYVEHAYEALAEITGTTLEEVLIAIEELERDGYIENTNDKRQLLVNRTELLESWVSAYNKHLRPKLLLGRFKADNDWMLNAELKPSSAQWSGEAALCKLGKIISKYTSSSMTTAQSLALLAYTAKPTESVVIYATRHELKSMIQENRLKQDSHGNIEIFERFWHGEELETDGITVPWLLIYADLLQTKDIEKIKMASEYYHQFIENALK